MNFLGWQVGLKYWSEFLGREGNLIGAVFDKRLFLLASQIILSGSSKFMKR